LWGEGFRGTFCEIDIDGTAEGRVGWTATCTTLAVGRWYVVAEDIPEVRGLQDVKVWAKVEVAKVMRVASTAIADRLGKCIAN